MLKSAAFSREPICQISSVGFFNDLGVSGYRGDPELSALSIKQPAKIRQPRTKHGISGAFRHRGEQVSVRSEIGRDSGATAVRPRHHRRKWLVPLLRPEVHTRYGGQHRENTNRRRANRLDQSISQLRCRSVKVAQFSAIRGCGAHQGCFDVDCCNILRTRTQPKHRLRRLFAAACISIVALAHRIPLSADGLGPRVVAQPYLSACALKSPGEGRVSSDSQNCRPSIPSRMLYGISHKRRAASRLFAAQSDACLVLGEHLAVAHLSPRVSGLICLRAVLRA